MRSRDRRSETSIRLPPLLPITISRLDFNRCGRRVALAGSSPVEVSSFEPVTSRSSARLRWADSESSAFIPCGRSPDMRRRVYGDYDRGKSGWFPRAAVDPPDNTRRRECDGLGSGAPGTRFVRHGVTAIFGAGGRPVEIAKQPWVAPGSAALERSAYVVKALDTTLETPAPQVEFIDRDDFQRWLEFSPKRRAVPANRAPTPPP